MADHQTIGFRRGFGYKSIDVDLFIDKTITAQNELQHENTRLQQETAGLTEQLNAMCSALLLLRQEVDTLRQKDRQRTDETFAVLEAVNKTAAQIVEDAHVKAQEMEASLQEQEKSNALLLACAKEQAEEYLCDARKKAKEIEHEAQEQARRAAALYLCMQDSSLMAKTYLQEIFDGIEKLEAYTSSGVALAEKTSCLLV